MVVNVSFISSDLWQFLGVSLIFHDLDNFEMYRLGILYFLVLFCDWSRVMNLGEECYRGECPSYSIIAEVHSSSWLIPGDSDLELLVKVESVRFIHCRSFPWLICWKPVTKSSCWTLTSRLIVGLCLLDRLLSRALKNLCLNGQSEIINPGSSSWC